MTKNGIKQIPNKKDVIVNFKKLHPEMSSVINILKYILHPKI